MGPKSKTSKPEVVQAKPVVLGKGHLAEIAMVHRIAGPAAAKTRREEIVQALEVRRDKNQAYIQEQMIKNQAKPLAFSQTKTGLGLVSGSGTRWDGVYTKERLLELCERIEELREFAESLPDAE